MHLSFSPFALYSKTAMDLLIRNLILPITLTLLLLVIHDPEAYASQSFYFLGTKIPHASPPYLDQDEGSMQITISEKGLNYAKDLLVSQALQVLTSLRISDMEKSVQVPFIGAVLVKLSNITLDNIMVPSSTFNLGQDGINIVASQVEVNLTMNWKYSYRSWFIPFIVSDKGRALVKVKGIEVGSTLRLDEKNGTLYLISMECGTLVKDISITLDGGASWFYQGLVDAFEGRIRAAVESAVTSKLMEGITSLDSFLQNLPKEIGIDNTVALNFTVMQTPVVGPTSISIGVEGLFLGVRSSDVLLLPVYNLHPRISCSGPSKMLEIALSQAVLNSAADVYTNAGLLNWLVDKLPEQSLLNTASWRFFVPQLYNKYPNDDMTLNISISSPPSITITLDGVEAVVIADMVVDVVDGSDTVPVACISMVISASGSMGVSGNNITGVADLSDLTLKLKWSNIGNFHMHFIQAIVRTLVKDVLLPLVNQHLKRGFPLPIIKNFRVQDADVLYGESQLLVCADVQYML